MTGGQALAAQLVREGVTTVFGVPGVQLDPAFDGLYGERAHIRVLGPRHEQAATYMADGYARSRGEAGVALVVPGPGVLNALAGLATAYACSSPVLLIAGQIPSTHIGKGLGLLHEIPDQSAILGSLTKWSGRAERADDIAPLVRAAMHQLHSGRPRPVAIEVPPDVLAAPVGSPLSTPAPGGRDCGATAPDPARIDAAAALLSAAERPVVWVGSGVLRAGATAELQALAERLGAPVVMSDNGRGALSDRHPLALTSLAGGVFLAGADVIVSVGSRFVTQAARAVASHGRRILINADAADLGGLRHADVAIEADARLALAALVQALCGAPAARPYSADAFDRARADAARALAPLQPQMAYVRALRRAMPDDGILVNELTQVGYVARVAYPVYGPNTLIGPGYQGTLGYGFAAALGVQAAHPGRAVVSITGDGGFGWCLSELATARRYDLPLVTVVFNDGAFGNVRRIQKTQYGGRLIATDLRNPDFVRLAGAFDVDAARVDSPDALEHALAEALRARKPALIEVPVGEMPSPWGLLDHSNARA